MSLLTKIFGDPNAKVVASIQPLVTKINALEDEMGQLSDEELKAKTPFFKQRLAAGETLDDILPEVFAVVREASKRTTGMRHYDVQMIGGIVLHQGKIAEMRTGEGKTLVATLPVYLNALMGKGVHLVTVNDYLARRDAVWMGQIYDFLGMTVGVVQNQRVSYAYDANSKVKAQNSNPETKNQQTIEGQKNLGEGGPADKERDELGSFKVEYDYLRPCSRQETYRCDITYGTNNEFGFDYLRDNMVQTLGDMVMRPGSEMAYAIVDEVDSILIDEARTPLIISAPSAEATDQYYQFARLVKQLLVNEDYNVDEKMRASTLTEKGIAKFEEWLGVDNLYAEGGIRLVHHIEQALKAEVLFKRDKEYVVDGTEIVIIDEFTGRKMPGRRYSEGLHQAIEAKENLPIQKESQTLATITFQNLFRMYGKLAGMTGTAVTEAEEFGKIYNLEVVVIPTNKPDRRTDNQDRIYKTEAGKFKAVAERIKECRKKEQPILIGTASVEKNETLSAYLSSEGIPHEILNAKNHEREGEIIAQAGRAGAVTLATNMAGRGVDIKLGGVPLKPEEEKKVVAAGGLFVLGTERHESRRIDNQLRGRSARQGDPGETQFFVSTDDDLMRIFAGDRMKAVMTRLNVPDDMPIEQGMITKMLESAQKKVESHNFDIRKHLLEYDDVLNKHREVIYKKRRQILELGMGTNMVRQKEKEVANELFSETKSDKAIHGDQRDQAISGDQRDRATSSDPSSLLGASPGKSDGQEAETVIKEGTKQIRTYMSYKEMILEMIEKEIEVVVSFHTNTEDRKDWNMQEIYETVRTIFPVTGAQKEQLFSYGKRGDSKLGDVEAREALVKFLFSLATDAYVAFEGQFIAPDSTNRSVVESIEKSILLRAIDTLWVDHLVAIDHLRAGIGLRGYGQRDPLVEYKKETYMLFNELLSAIQKEVVYSFFKLQTGLSLAPSIMATDKMTLQGATKEQSAQGEHIEKKPRDEAGEKIGRNDPCYCGSGKKFKKCHGA